MAEVWKGGRGKVGRDEGRDWTFFPVLAVPPNLGDGGDRGRDSGTLWKGAGPFASSPCHLATVFPGTVPSPLWIPPPLRHPPNAQGRLENQGLFCLFVRQGEESRVDTVAC